MLSLTIRSKYDNDEKFVEFKEKVKSKHEIIKQIKDLIKPLDDILNKIKDYKSQDLLDYLNIMSQLSRLAKSSKENNKVFKLLIKEITSSKIKNLAMKQNSENLDLIGSTPHFESKNESEMKENDKSKNIRISEFQAEDLDTSKNNHDSFQNNSYLDNSYIMKTIDEEYVKTLKPVNPLSFRDDPDKSFDNSNNNSHNCSMISENKLQSYAQKTKKLNIDKMNSFKSLNFKKQKNIENKYDDEYKNIDDKSKAVYNACETISSNLLNSKVSSNKVNSNIKGITNPFNISNKINKFQKTSSITENRTVKFEIDDRNDNNQKKDIIHSTPDRNIGSEFIKNNNSFSNNNNKNDTSFNNNTSNFNTELDQNDNQTNANIDNKLRSLITDPKIIASKVLKTGSLLSLLNFGIKSTSILVCSKINVSEIYINAKKKKEEKNK